MSAWDELLAATHPGREVEAGPDAWLIMRRSWRPEDVHLGRTNVAELRITLVRSGSEADPRTRYDDLSGGIPPSDPPPGDSTEGD